MKVLFVCTINRMRSATAQVIFAEDPRFEVRSAGTSSSASNVLDLELMDWADAILVMERAHRNEIRKRFPSHYESKKIVCLYIPDDFDFMQPELIAILRDRVDEIIRKGLL